MEDKKSGEAQDSRHSDSEEKSRDDYFEVAENPTY